MSIALTSDSSGAFQSARAETAYRRTTAARMAEGLWANGQLMDAFLRRSRGWENSMARVLGVTRDDLSAFVSGMGGYPKVRALVFGNPAGAAPAGVDLKKLPLHMAESYGCPTSGCGTSGCPTSGCGTAHCGTYACGGHKPGQHKPEIV